MKIEELKKLIKSSVREVVREELEYHFNKLYESVERNSGTSSPQPVRSGVPKKKNAEMINNLTEKYRMSFEGMMNEDIEQDQTYRPQKRMSLKNDNILTRTVFHDTAPLQDEDSDSVRSVLDESTIQTLRKSDKMKAVHNALTRNYSDLIKAMS